MESDLDEEFLFIMGLLYCRLKKKKNRRMWLHPIVKERSERSMFYTLFNMELKADDEKFFNFVRMSKKSFNELLNYIKNNITKENTIMRDSIPPEEKLVITLR